MQVGLPLLFVKRQQSLERKWEMPDTIFGINKNVNEGALQEAVYTVIERILSSQ